MEKFYDIYGFYHVPFWKSRPFVITSSIIITLLSLFIIYKIVVFIRNKRLKKPQLWELVANDIKALNPAMLSSKDEFKKFYFDLGLVLKKYFSQRYGLQLHDKTDDEIDLYLKNQKLDVDFAPGFIEILHGSRYVKFAGDDVLPNKALNDWKLSLELVKITIPKD